MNFISTAIRRPVTTVMLVLIVVILGFVSLTNLSLDLLPNLDFPIAVVSTSMSGSGPKEIETLVTQPLEAALGTVNNLKTIQSSSSNGSSLIILEFADGTDIDFATLQMRERVDLVKRALPEEAGDPTVMKIDPNSMTSGYTYSVSDQTGMGLTALKNLVDERIVGRLERQDGVASVSVSGGLEREIQITLKPEKLKSFGISAAQIAQTLASENINRPSGQVKQGDLQLQIRTVGEFTHLDDIRDLPILAPGGAVIYMRDVAEIEEVYKQASSTFYANGRPGVSITVDKQSTANTVSVSDALNAEIDAIRADLPEVEILTVMDPSLYIRQALGNVTNTLLLGAFLAVLILFVFLHNVRSTFIVGVAIPLSVIATFVLMYFTHVTFNMISLGGLVLGIGMLVDNSIVVMESIYRHMELGRERKEAAFAGAKEVAMPVFASTLTTVAVFLPIVFIEGIAATLFKEMALTVSYSLLSSLAVALTWVPMACAHFLNLGARDAGAKASVWTRLSAAWDKGLGRIDAAYRKLLHTALRHRKLVTLLTLAVFIGTLVFVPTVGMEFMPNMDQGTISVSIQMPRGTLLEETAKVADTAWARIKDIPELKEEFLTIGGGGMMSFGGGSGDRASFTLNLIDLEERTRGSSDIAEEIRQKLSDLPGPTISVSAVSGMVSMGGTDISIQLSGDDLDELERIANDVKALVESVDGTTEVSTSLQDGAPESSITIDRAKASLYGISASTVASAVSAAVTGSVVGKYKVDGTELDIRVRQDPAGLDYVNDVENILIPTPYGAYIPLYELAVFHTEHAPRAINRENQTRYVTVEATILGRDLNSVSTDIIAQLNAYPFPAQYKYSIGGQQEQMTEAFSSLGLALILAVILVYMIMASQFEHLLHPFIVMFSMPAAMTTGILGLILMRTTLNVTSFIGLIMLAGIVVNNGIVLIDYINQLRASGMSLFEAIEEAGPVRLRPILMTTLTTVLGLLPMVLATGSGTEMQRGLGVTVSFGLTLSTLVTLVYLPVLYVVAENIRSRLMKIFSRRQKAEASAPPSDTNPG